MSTNISLPQHILAGAIAGTTELALLYPLDLIKTRQQLTIGPTSPSLFSSFQSLIRTEGVLRLYRGIAAPILVEAPKRATKFSANEYYKLLIGIGNWQGIVCGVLSGITEAFVVVGFDLVKVRLQDKSSVDKYRNAREVVLYVYKREGVRGFFRGLEATMWRHGVWSGGYFGTIGILRKKRLMSNGLWNNFLYGLIGGTIGTCLNTPFDVVKSRIQNTGKGRWVMGMLFDVWKAEGYKALYKGFGAKLMRLGPGGGIMLVVFDAVVKVLK